MATDIVNDDIYEGSEHFVLKIEQWPGLSFDLVQFADPDGTTCISCVPEYRVNITDEEDLPELSLSALPASIAEEDDDGTTGTAENVSTVTVEITNGKTFAVDQTVTLTFSGTATQGTHYSVSPGDADTNEAGHQVVLVNETASVDVTVTATGNDTDDGNRTVTVAADLDGTAIGTTGITILDDETTTTTVPDAPTSLTATASGTTAIDLSWTAPADNGGSPITGYRIEVSSNGGTSWTNRVGNTGTTTTTYSHTGLSAGATRHYRVSAINSVGTGAASNVDNATTATTVPGAPTSLTATASGTTAINLSWTAPADDGGSDITGYRIEVSPNGTSSWNDLVANTGSTTTYSHTGLDAGDTRHYRVSAINSVGTGAASNVDDATTDAAAPTVPGAPTGLSATASGTSTIDLDWTAPVDDGGAAITGYRIEVSPDGTSDWTERVGNTGTTTASYSHTGLSAATTRHYRVSAINSAGTGAASSTANATTDAAAATVPGAPTGLSATASGTSTIDLDWTAPVDDGGAAITGYRIEVSPDGTSDWTERVGNTGTTTASYSHTGLSAATTRHYRVSAINSAGTGAASSTANATTDAAAATVPGAPTGLSATASGTSTIDLDWTAPTDNGGSDITGYRIEVSSDGNSSWTDREANTGNTSTTYSHTSLSAGTTRHYRVSAINSVGTGAASNVDDATTDDDAPTVPGAPTGLSATASGTSTIDLSWTAPTDNGGSDITGYRIEVSSDGNSSWTDREANTGNTSTTYSHTSLSAGTTRHYRVSAINSVGTGAASNVDDATTDDAAPTVPGAPTSLSATASGTSTIDLDWTEPADNGDAAITGYRIEVSSNGSSGWSNRAANTGNTSTNYSHTGLDAGTTRHYRVSAINSVGTGAASSTANATTDDDAPTVPGAPTGLSATADGTSTIDLDWTAPTDNGGSDITGYRIEVSSDGSSGWSNRAANTGNTSTNYSHTGLDAGTTRHYRVSAINSVGTGAASSTANATTDDDAPTVPGAPTGLSATADGTSTIDLDWTAPTDNGGSDITGYRIEVSSDGNSSWTDREANTGNTSTTYSHTSLSAGTTRHYRVSAINSVGTGAASNVDDATTDAAATTVPGAPTSLTATASGTSTIDLDWTAPVDDGGAAITGYRIEVSPDGTSDWTERVGNTGTTTASYSHTGLSAATTRHYRVSAINSAGTGTASSTANATTDAAAATVPGAPTSLSATASGTSTIDLDWTAPVDDGGAAITGYRIEVSPDGTSDWTERVGNTGTTTASYSHTGLDAGTTRHYRVSAINSAGTGTASSTANATTDAAARPGLAVVTVHALETSVSVDGVARFELRRSGGDLGWLKVSYRHDESSDGNYVKSWGYFKPGVTRKGAAYHVGRSPGTVTARVTGPSDPLCTEGDSPSASCTDDYVVGDPSSASMQVTASASSSDDALEDALTLVDDLPPDVAAAVLLGEQTLGEAELAALDRLGNGNGRYDLGDLLSWIDRCRRGEARCGRTSTDSGPAAAALLGGAAAGGRRTPRRPGRRDSGRRGGASTGGIRRRARMAGQVLAVLLAATTVWSCTEGSVAPAAYVQDPGFLTVEWSGPATHRDVGVLLELEGPTIDAVRAPGLELYESSSPGPHRIVVAGVLRPGPLVQFRVPDRGQFALYRVRVLEVTGEGYGLRDPTEYRAVVIMN